MVEQCDGIQNTLLKNMVHAFESVLILGNPTMSDVHNNLSSIPLFGSYGLMPTASFMESFHLIIGLPFYLLLSIYLSITVFSKEPGLLMMCLK